MGEWRQIRPGKRIRGSFLNLLAGQPALRADRRVSSNAVVSDQWSVVRAQPRGDSTTSGPAGPAVFFQVPDPVYAFLRVNLQR